MKNGTTAAGTQRWICRLCGASSTRRRPDVTSTAQLERFVAWLTGSRTQSDLDGGTGRTFRHQHAWCWKVSPTIPITGEIYDEIQLDGTYLSGGWCLLIAMDGASGNVIAWQWCDTEKTAAWIALLERIPPPRVVVIDGGSGLASALKACWPHTPVQRCLVHVQRNVRRELTRRPRTEAGRALRALSLALTRVATLEQAATWSARLHEWHQTYGELITAKTYLRQVGTRPASVPANATWWWTHERLRKAYRLLERLSRQGALFTFLDPDLAELDISSTTNRIEGGVNHPIKALLRCHRGMSEDHRRRSAEWWCYLHSPQPRPLARLIRPEHTAPLPQTHSAAPEPRPGDYGTSPTAEEGLWARKGWGGRSR